MKYEVKIEINGIPTTISLDEKIIRDINEQIIVQKISALVGKIVEEYYPRTPFILKDNYEKALSFIAYEVLDSLETEGMTQEVLSCIEDDLPVSNEISHCITDISYRMLYPFAEIRYNNFDTIENCYTIDAWCTDDDNEEGVVVAKVFLDKTVEFVSEDSKYHADVLLAIEECLKSVSE